MVVRLCKNNVLVFNLYLFYSRKVNKVYWWYKYLVIGKFYVLGINEVEVIVIVIEVNICLVE